MAPKLLFEHIVENYYRMSNIPELIDNIAQRLSNKMSGEIWFSSLDLRNAYSQSKLLNNTSKQFKVKIMGGETTATYRCLTGVYGLGDMPNEFHPVMDLLLKIFSDDILITSKSYLEEHKSILGNHKIIEKFG